MIATLAAGKLGLSPEPWGISDDALFLAYNLILKTKPKRVLCLGASNLSVLLAQNQESIPSVTLEENMIVATHIQKKMEGVSDYQIQHCPLIDSFGTQVFKTNDLGVFDFIVVDAPRFAGKGRGLTLVQNDLIDPAGCTIVWGCSMNGLTVSGIREVENKFGNKIITSFFEGRRDGSAISFVYPEDLVD